MYVAQDANYNVMALFDISGNIVERYAYSPYGLATILAPDWSERPASLFAWQHLHQGLRFEPLTGLYHNRAREYSPTLMRFVAQDPIGFAGGSINLYVSYLNAPLNLLDPTGHFPWVFALIALAVAGAGGAGAYYGATTGEESGLVEGFAPGWGAGRTSGAAFAKGQPVKGVIFALLVPVDALTMGSVGSGCVKVCATQGARGFLPGTFRVAVGPGASSGGKLPHMAWRVSGSNPLHGGRELPNLMGRAIWPPFNQRITHEGAMRFWFREGSETAAGFWFRRGTQSYPFLPVASRGLASLAGGRASSCYTAALGAWSRGNYHLVPYLGSHAGLDLSFGRYSDDLPAFNFGFGLGGPEFQVPPGFALVFLEGVDGHELGPMGMQLPVDPDPEPYVDPVSPSRASLLRWEAWRARNRR